jgi:hypothetical protein
MDRGYHQVAFYVITHVSVCLIPFQGPEWSAAGLGKAHEFFNG